MKSPIAKCLVLVAIVGMCAATANAETLEEVKKKIHDKVSGYKSLEYKGYATTDFNTPQFSSKSKTEMTAQYLKQGEKILGRTESKINSEQKMGDQVSKNTVHITSISDGQFDYTIQDTDGVKTATKSNLAMNKELNPFNTLGMFKTMEETYDVKLMPDETVDGKPAWVLEMKPKDPAAAATMGRTISYYDKESGISIKSTSYDPAGKPISTFITKDIKVNSSISPDRFVFKAPPGVEVMDTTQMPK